LHRAAHAVAACYRLELVRHGNDIVIAVVARSHRVAVLIYLHEFARGV
jgi:predicted nucleic acid-binding protein